MKNTTADYQNMSTATRAVLGAVGFVMLAAFYAAAIGGATLGSGVYLGILSIVPITLAIMGWSPVVLTNNKQEEPLALPAH